MALTLRSPTSVTRLELGESVGARRTGMPSLVSRSSLRLPLLNTFWPVQKFPMLSPQ